MIMVLLFFFFVDFFAALTGFAIEEALGNAFEGTLFADLREREYDKDKGKVEMDFTRLGCYLLMGPKILEQFLTILITIIEVDIRESNNVDENCCHYCLDCAVFQNHDLVLEILEFVSLMEG